MKKYLARPLVNRNRCSAGFPWFVITELARSRRSVAAPRMISRSRWAIPSNNLEFKPAREVAIPVAGIRIPLRECRILEVLEALQRSRQTPNASPTAHDLSTAPPFITTAFTHICTLAEITVSLPHLLLKQTVVPSGLLRHSLHLVWTETISFLEGSVAPLWSFTEPDLGVATPGRKYRCFGPRFARIKHLA